MCWPERFPTPCILLPPLALFAGFDTVGARCPSGAPAKSKVVTGAPSYPLARTFLDPMHSCAAARALLMASVAVGRFLTPCLTPGARRPSGAPAKSKVVTGAPSYALALTFSDPVHSCATVRALC